jgi:uncharacterized membrane protein YeaQ/YmgE (transglycosylase-associated protein family)
MKGDSIMTNMASWIFLTQHPVTQRDVVVYVETHSIVWWLLIGLIAGWLAGTVARGRGFGCVVDIILGLIGAVIGGAAWLPPQWAQSFSSRLRDCLPAAARIN